MNSERDALVCSKWRSVRSVGMSVILRCGSMCHRYLLWPTSWCSGKRTEWDKDYVSVFNCFWYWLSSGEKGRKTVVVVIISVFGMPVSLSETCSYDNYVL